MKILSQRLELLYETCRKAKTTDKPQATQTFRKQAPYQMNSITSRQNSSPCETDDENSTTLARVLLIAELTDIHPKKWIEETDRDPEINLLKQAVIDKNSKQIPASCKLFKNELRVSMGLVFIDDKNYSSSSGPRGSCQSQLNGRHY